MSFAAEDLLLKPGYVQSTKTAVADGAGLANKSEFGVVHCRRGGSQQFEIWASRVFVSLCACVYTMRFVAAEVAKIILPW